MLAPEQHESGGGGASGGSSGGGTEEFNEKSGGNRWPKQETLVLLRIRSDMDVAFRDSNLKGPLWDQISRKMAEHGYTRSAKKCKEKFENVYKYHKRTKDYRTTKPDGKTYRFFDQLKALENNTSPQLLLPPPTTTAAQPSVTNIPMPTPLNISVTQTANNIPINTFPSYQTSQQPPVIPLPQAQTTFQPSHHMSRGILSNSTSSSSTSSDEDVQTRIGKKRKWKDLFEKLMNDVVEKQEELQKKFLDTLERRERDRVSREEAWRVQEMAKMNREHELLIKERSMASAREEAVITFLQKVSEQHNFQISNNNNTNKIASPSPPPPPPQLVTQAQQPPALPPPQSTTPPQATISTPEVIALPTQTNTMVVYVNNNGNTTNVSTSSSRWPKEEIEALINIRTGLEFKYQDTGPKGPLWEEISLAMGKQGYNRNSKRCKEKWENINKYYKKVKESNKKRPEDSKTCPYFNQLEAIYNKKAKTSENQLPIMAQPEQQWPIIPPQQHHDMESDNNNNDVVDDEDEELDEEEAARYEIVTNKQQPICSVTTNAVE